MQPRSSTHSGRTDQISSRSRPEEQWTNEAGPSRPRACHGAGYDGAIGTSMSPHYASPHLPRSPDEYADAAYLHRTRLMPRQHDVAGDFAYDVNLHRPYVSPISPDPAYQDRYHVSRPDYPVRPEHKRTSRQPPRVDPDLPHQSILDARYGSPAYATRHERSSAYATPQQPIARPSSRGHTEVSPVVLGWSPRKSASATSSAPTIDLADPRQKAYQQARLEHILRKAGRTTDRWPPVEEMSAVLHWNDEILVSYLRDPNWRPPKTLITRTPQRFGRAETHTAPARTHSPGLESLISHNEQHRAELAELRGLGIRRTEDRRIPGVPPPQAGLAPSYEMDPGRLHMRPMSGGATVSHPSGREVSHHLGNAMYSTYALDDTPRRARMLMSPEQQRVLQALWAVTRFPTLQQREECGDKVNLTNRQVQVWFQRQKARKQTAAGAEHAYSAELSQRGRPSTQDGGESTSSSRPDSRGSDALGLSFDGHERETGTSRGGRIGEIAQPASPRHKMGHSPSKNANRHALPSVLNTALNPFGKPSAAEDRQIGLPSIHDLLGQSTPTSLDPVLAPIRSSSSRHARRQNSDNLFEPHFSSTLAVRRTSLSQGSSPRQDVRAIYSPLVPAQRLPDRSVGKAGRRISQPYIKTISTSTTSTTDTALRFSPTKDSGEIGTERHGGWPKSAVPGEEEERTPRVEDDRHSINLQ